MTDSNTLIDDFRRRADAALRSCLPAVVDGEPLERLHRALHYAALGGGKRVRPVLVYSAGYALDAALDTLDASACAVELIHAYSLVHDDLPAMDDDDLRRGRPTCHKAFDEATAILAGDALQTLAFQVLSDDPGADTNPMLQLRRVALLAEAAGAAGMVGGQALDLAAVGRCLTLDELEAMHSRKTGALIRASVLLGGLGLADERQRQLLEDYGRCVGLAFQIQDDILDVTGDTVTLGKTSGADQALDKPTYPELLGLDGAREHADRLCRQALDCAARLGPRAEALAWIAGYIIDRNR